MILFHAVYDITGYYDKHPKGGLKVIDKFIGKDGTDVFAKVGHLSKESVVKKLSTFRLGRYVQSAKL